VKQCPSHHKVAGTRNNGNCRPLRTIKEKGKECKKESAAICCNQNRGREKNSGRRGVAAAFSYGPGDFIVSEKWVEGAEWIFVIPRVHRGEVCWGCRSRGNIKKKKKTPKRFWGFFWCWVVVLGVKNSDNERARLSKPTGHLNPHRGWCASQERLALSGGEARNHTKSTA